jgi:energy-converting hydrogenase Eha subunit F
MTARGGFLAVLWLLIFPALGMGLYVTYATGYHPQVAHPHPVPFSCAQMAASLAPVDGGGQIAPMCDQAAYPTATP